MLDPESAEWVQMLTGSGSRREVALVRLHEMLVRIALGEVRVAARSCGSPVRSSMTWPIRLLRTR